MKTERKIVKGIMVTILFGMMITTLHAQKPNKEDRPGTVNQEQVLPLPPNAPSPPPPPPPPPPAVDNADMQAPLQLDLPDLSDEQRDKIHQASLDHMKAMTPFHNQIREKKARLQTILTTSPFDAKTADQVAEELGKIETGMLKEMIRHDQTLRNLLTPQQQVVFDSHPKPFLRRGK